jgi:hypothetical protein
MEHQRTGSSAATASARQPGRPSGFTRTHRADGGNRGVVPGIRQGRQLALQNQVLPPGFTPFGHCLTQTLSPRAGGSHNLPRLRVAPRRRVLGQREHSLKGPPRTCSSRKERQLRLSVSNRSKAATSLPPPSGTLIVSDGADPCGHWPVELNPPQRFQSGAAALRAS